MDIMYKIGRFARKKLIQLLPESSYKDKLLIQYVNTINNIVVIVGQNCTLKCRNCANFSPYLAKQLPFILTKRLLLIYKRSSQNLGLLIYNFRVVNFSCILIVRIF